MRDLYVNFQITDYDDDIVGMCLSLVEWMKWLFTKSKELNFEIESKPDKPSHNFYKHQPHFPRTELRSSARNVLEIAVKSEQDDITKYKNLFTCLLAITYIYHMPSERMYEIAKNNESFNREKATQILLDDNMSSNWLSVPKPSNRDYTALIK